MADKTKYFDYETVKEMLYDLEYEGKDVDPTDYPYIEIADEHGDLIDRDKLLDSEKMFFAEKYQGDHRTNYDTMMGYEIGNMLRDAPVVLERTT